MTGHPPGQAVVSVSRTPVRSLHPAHAQDDDASVAELQFDVKFTIAELVVMAPNWAYVRTNSAGTTFHRSLGKKLAEANQELFICKKSDDSKWCIVRYSFSPTNPSCRVNRCRPNMPRPTPAFASLWRYYFWCPRRQR